MKSIDITKPRDDLNRIDITKPRAEKKISDYFIKPGQFNNVVSLRGKYNDNN